MTASFRPGVITSPPGPVGHTDGVELRRRERAFEQPPEERQPVRDRAGVVVRAGVGGRLLGIEVVHVDVPQTLRRDVRRAGDQVPLRRDPVELRERVQALLDASDCAGTAACRRRSCGSRTRSPRRGTACRAISGPSKFSRGVAVRRPRRWWLRMRNSGSGSFSSHFHWSPPRRVSTVTRPGGEAPEFGQVRRLVNVQRLDTVDRHGEAELAGRGVGHVRRIDDQARCGVRRWRK